MGGERARRRAAALALGISAATGGCVDGFRGSNVQLDLGYAVPAQASPGAVPRADQLPANAHYRLYAVQTLPDREHLFELQRFEIHLVVDLASPCFIDVGEHVPHPGLHVSQYATQIGIDTGIPDFRDPPPGTTEAQQIDAATAAQRMLNIAALGGDRGIKVATSASTATYPTVAADCTPVVDQIPPPQCADPASNTRRLARCQEAWAADPGLWEGTDRVLTAPLAGTTYGMVDGLNPVNLAPVGGATFFIDEALTDVDGYALYWQLDGVDAPGTLVMFGRPTAATRGVSHVHLTSPSNPTVTAEMVVFADLGNDEVHF